MLPAFKRRGFLGGIVAGVASLLRENEARKPQGDGVPNNLPSLTRQEDDEWQLDWDAHGSFRWRRHPTLYDLFMENPHAPEFYARFILDGKDYGPRYYPVLWQIQRWDWEKGDWGEAQSRMELPGMD